MSTSAGINRGVAVQARNVVVEYERTRDKTTLVALEDFNLDVAEGEFVAIVGPSGCGKSTFLNAVAGLIFPVAGEVEHNWALDGGSTEEAFEQWNTDMIDNENVPADFDWREHVDFSCLTEAQENLGLEANPGDVSAE